MSAHERRQKTELRAEVDSIINAALAAAQPDDAVRRAIDEFAINDGGTVMLLAVGKAAYGMAKTACSVLGSHITRGIVITKYGHGGPALPCCEVYEAGHPIPDDNSFAATRRAVSLAESLGAGDRLLLLLSGGGSALLEKPLVSNATLQNITRSLLKSGAEIGEINTIRKRLSAVKAGRFAKICAPAHVYCAALSDVLGDRPDMIASGPVSPDSSTSAQALAIIKKYKLRLSADVIALLREETPKRLDNVSFRVIGNLATMCDAAAQRCRELGYDTEILSLQLNCEARSAGELLAKRAQMRQSATQSFALLAAGETVVKVRGNGLGGRNQELALAAAIGIDGLSDTAVFSVGSDGTDGPTDAAGGYVDGDSAAALRAAGVDIDSALSDNDSYHALQKCGGLIITGATGTNVNDLCGLLLRR